MRLGASASTPGGSTNDAFQDRQFLQGQSPGYGLLVEGGVIDASARRRARWPTLREVIADNALPSLIQMAGKLTPDLAVEEIVFEIPIPLPKKSSAWGSIIRIATRNIKMVRRPLPIPRFLSGFRAPSSVMISH